jgi:hypothetical protein
MSGSSPGERGDLVLSLCESARAVKRGGVWTWCGQRARADQKGRTTEVVRLPSGMLQRSVLARPVLRLSEACLLLSGCPLDHQM